MEFEEVKNEQIAWRHNSRIQWLKSGDKNTKVFSQDGHNSQEVQLY